MSKLLSTTNFEWRAEYRHTNVDGSINMAWENIEERLKKALNVKITFPSGTVWLPDAHLTIDDWLTSLAQTDEELREPSDRRSIWAMYVGGQAYVLFF